ncbi:MAG: beta-galactosidase [bacterium]|nr:beta-galactosidase [bacterium]
MNTPLPRAEYPRPQCVRPDWLCLNGAWQFEIDAGDSGLERGLLQRDLAQRIVVPFCPESILSGIAHTDFMNVVWYRRSVCIPAAWAGRMVLLHFQAVDYDTTVWVNGTEVGRHRGGFTPFTCPLDGVAAPGDNITIVVRARDLQHEYARPVGKQSSPYANAGCHYTRTTGIWQTVWLEPVPRVHLGRPRITPNLAAGTLQLDLPVTNSRRGTRVQAVVRDARGDVCTASAAADADFTPQLLLAIPAARRRVWSPTDPFLYDLCIELRDANDTVLDTITSYAGLRSVTIDGHAVLLNGTPLFQRLVLDQGYYPDGIMTAPSDAALRLDIELSMAAGFNGARLHQKVFEERFLYHADRLGYLVWGEFADWKNFAPNQWFEQPRSATFITQWLEVLQRDYSHPSIVGWCPLNETVEGLGDTMSALDDVTRGMYLAAKAMDVTRPALDTSGYSHRVTDADIFDCHDYEADPAVLRQHHAGLATGAAFSNIFEQALAFGKQGREPVNVPYRQQPFFVSEWGGIWWNPEVAAGESSWGYGQRPKSIEEFYTRFEGLCMAMLDHPAMFGYCYTQLTDVFQEQNGIFHFDRRAKFDCARLREIQQRRAAIERAEPTT